MWYSQNRQQEMAAKSFCSQKLSFDAFKIYETEIEMELLLRRESSHLLVNCQNVHCPGLGQNWHVGAHSDSPTGAMFSGASQHLL